MAHNSLDISEDLHNLNYITNKNSINNNNLKYIKIINNNKK